MVFKYAQNYDSDNDGSWMVSGNELHKVGPETAKLLVVPMSLLIP